MCEICKNYLNLIRSFIFTYLKIMNDATVLSKREKVILTALASGSLYKEIAADHHISINTVKKHLKNIYRKLEVNKRTQAIALFLQGSSERKSITSAEMSMTG